MRLLQICTVSLHTGRVPALLYDFHSLCLRKARAWLCWRIRLLFPPDIDLVGLCHFAHRLAICTLLCAWAQCVIARLCCCNMIRYLSCRSALLQCRFWRQQLELARSIMQPSHLTFANIRCTRSLGCAPHASQYLTRSTLSSTSFTPVVRVPRAISLGYLGTGSYEPTASIGRQLRRVLGC